MPLIDVAALAPVQRLLTIAEGDTGQSHIVASFLLAWWNAQACGGFDLIDLWAEQPKVPRAPARGKAAEGVDEAITRDMLATAAFVASHGEYPTTYGLGPQFEALILQWRPALAQGDGHG